MGTLSAILSDVATHLEIDRETHENPLASASVREQLDPFPKDRTVTSNVNHLVTHHAKPNYLGSLWIVEMAAYRIADQLLQLFESIRLRKNRVAQSPRLVTAFG